MAESIAAPVVVTVVYVKYAALATQNVNTQKKHARLNAF
jgi:hypothetical protein